MFPFPDPAAALPQLSMLFTEECDKVRDLMHVHSFSYDFHLRLVHQHVLGAHLVVVNSPALPAYSEGGWSLGFWPASVQMVNTKMDVSRVPTDNAGEMTRGGDVGLNTFGRNSYELN